MAEVLRNLKGKIKDARNKSYLGCYPESLDLYSEVLGVLASHIGMVKEPALKTDWQKLVDMMQTEKNLVSDVNNPLAVKSKKKTTNIAQSRAVPK